MHNDGYHVHDPGGEFVGIEFQTLLQDCHIRDVCSNAENPQSSAICKRISVVYHPNTGHLAGTISVNYQHWPVDIQLVL